MSVDSQVVSVATVGGMGGGAVSSLAETGNPAIVALIVGGAMLVVLGMLTRATQQ